ncbi:tail fiber domain-containing protein [Dyadobacter sp. CY326]|uniref:tail fiber domain-containing protein n=1 Tax=Dyadobacter sp. CY326 TaxID=2907300 RepID=UPI001F36C3D8|nr:tail fiber domain-containing protein [Dyadobacter sp. CY326]MCE7068113.1 tail fiber domain-containing protein [Dyadobacter sp. CY326]
MKQSLVLGLLLFCVTTLLAQAPQQFSFQGVARDAAGKILFKKNITLRATIRQGNAAGQNVYSETHEALTDNNGIFNLDIGAGSILNGSFQQIAWIAQDYFLQLEIDTEGGSNFVDLGATQLLSVPYSLHAKEASQWVQQYPVIQSGALNQSPIMTDLGPKGPKLIWYPRKAAFRVGEVINDEWNEINIGVSSFASGTSTTAKGLGSVALGGKTKAIGAFSLAHGYESESSGGASFSMGFRVISKALHGFSIGIYNNITDSPFSFEQPTDRLFQIGNGSEDNRSNALTVLRNGNIGIGNNATEPGFVLDVGGRARIKHNGSTAGFYLDNSEHKPQGFVGMMNDQQIGFYLNSQWRFWVNSQGNGYLGGALIQTSDRRLKRNFTSLSESLSKLSALQGYNYFWKDTLKDQTIQTGLIAQEVETLFPELVKTDDKGFKSVNYIGLVPHLIEAVKELQKANDLLKSSNQKMQFETEKTNDAIKMIEAKLDQLQQKLSTDSN